LPDDVVVSRGEEEVALERARFWCDATAFEELCDVGRLKDALNLYRGDFLDGFHLTGAPEFERWVDRKRMQLRERGSAAAWSLAEGAEEVGDRAAAAKWGHRAAVLIPDNEEALRRLIALLDRLGDRAQALREYEAFAKRLREDYGAEPAPETRDLITAVRARVEANSRVDDVASAAGSEEEHDDMATGWETVPQAQHPGRRWRAIALTAVAVILSAVGALVVNSREDRPALDRTRVLVDVFQNETGDPSLDHLGRMATDWITQGLSYTTFVDVVSLGTPLLSRLPAAADSGSSRDSGRLQMLAEANASGTVVWGSYYRQGDSVHFQAHVTDARNREELASLAPERGLVGAPVDAVERLRDRVMTTLATLTDPRLAKWSRYASKPPTFKAYQEFVAGIELHTTEMKFAEAIQHFLRAAEVDSTFTMPLLWAIMSSGLARQRSLGDSLVQELEERREELAPLDRYFLDYQAARRRGDTMASLQAMRQVVEIAPGSDYLKIAGNAALGVNRPREAIKHFEAADPESGWLRGWALYWLSLADSYHMVGEYQRSLEIARHARGKFPSGPWNAWMRRTEAMALAALGRTRQLNELVGQQLDSTIFWSFPRRPWSGWDPSTLFCVSVSELRRHGHGTAAEELLARAMTWYDSLPPTYLADLNDRNRAVARNNVPCLLYHAQRWGALRQFAEVQLTGAVALGWLAVVAARQGNRAEAQELSKRPELDRAFARRASIAANMGQRDRAVALLRENYAGRFNGSAHRSPLWEPLWGYPPFEEFLRPKG
jgi:tetratricopeptide (TPR) repeat protein